MPSEPLKLWEKYKDRLAEDYIRKHQNENKDSTEIPSSIYDKVLLKIRSYLEEQGKDLSDFGLPEPDGVLDEDLEPLAIREETEYDHDELAIEASNDEDQLNEGQRKFYDEVLKAVDAEKGGLFALDAPGIYDL